MATSETKLLETMGANIRRIRKAKGLKQYHLAEKSEMEKASLSRIESGQANPTVLTLRRLAVVLDVAVGDFFKD